MTLYDRNWCPKWKRAQDFMKKIRCLCAVIEHSNFCIFGALVVPCWVRLYHDLLIHVSKVDPVNVIPWAPFPVHPLVTSISNFICYHLGCSPSEGLLFCLRYTFYHPFLCSARHYSSHLLSTPISVFSCLQSYPQCWRPRVFTTPHVLSPKISNVQSLHGVPCAAVIELAPTCKAHHLYLGLFSRSPWRQSYRDPQFSIILLPGFGAGALISGNAFQ